MPIRDSNTTHPATTTDARTLTALLDLVETLAREINPGRTLAPLNADSTLEADAGLDSLGRTELLRRLEQRFDVTVAEEPLFAAECIGDLQALLETAPAPSPRPTPTTHATAPDTVHGVPHHAVTLTEALEWHAHTRPEQVHIHLYEGDAPAAPLTYGELWSAAARVAAGLRQLAVEPGQSVALMLPTGEDFFHAFVGILLAGAVPVPIYPPARMSQLEDHLRRQTGILDNAQAVMLITVERARPVGRMLKGLVPGLGHVVTAAELRELEAVPAQVRVSAEDIALLQYTSGSTGSPKGVVLSHANLLANIRAMGSALKVRPDDVFVSWLPLYHDMGLIGAWLGSLYHGMPLVLMSPMAFITRPQRWLQAIHHHRGTLSAAPNFAYDLCTHKIADDAIQDLDLSSLRFTCNGAEPVSADTIERFTARFADYGFRPEAMAPVYGLAECSVGLCFPPLGRRPRIDRILPHPFRDARRAVPAPAPGTAAAVLPMVGCGLPLPGHEVRVVDDSGHELGDREVGRLQFRGPSTTRGYFRNPKATAELLRDGWLDSGDYAYLADGEVFIAGRAKDLIIRAGRNIYPYDLEQAVGELEGIRRGAVAVFGSSAPDGSGERLVVVAETRERKTERLEALRHRIDELAAELVQVPPDDVVLAPPRSVLKTSSGKIRRAACRDLYEKGRLGHRRSDWSQWLHLGAAAALPVMARGVRNLRARTFAAYAWLLFGLLAAPVWLLVILLPGRRLPHGVVRAAIYALSWACAIPIRVRGREHLHDVTPFVVASNHASYLDALVLSAVLPHGFRFVAKRELGRNRFMRWFLDKAGTWYVDRFDAQRGMQDATRMTEAARSGEALVFFPEGTFTRAPGLGPFRLGAFVAAAGAGLPVVPIALRGTRAVLRSGHWFPRRGCIEVEFLAPVVPTGDDWQAAIGLRDAVRAAILKECAEPDLVELPADTVSRPSS